MGYRTDLSRARGLGAAKHGASHWLAERISAIALAPLSIWAVVSAFNLAGAPYEVVVDWLSKPLTTVLMVLLLLTAFWHMHAGMRVIVEDYIHKTLSKSVLLILNLFVCVLFGALAIVSILKVAVGGGAF